MSTNDTVTISRDLLEMLERGGQVALLMAKDLRIWWTVEERDLLIRLWDAIQEARRVLQR